MFFDTEFLKNDEICLVLERTAPEDAVRRWLPAYHFLICLPDGTWVGRCDFRVGHNENTYYGGNIGYSIAPEWRGHHYAGKACLLLLELAKKHGMDCVIITCAPENAASRKTCEYAGGVLQETADLPEHNEMYLAGDRKKCIYRFDLG